MQLFCAKLSGPNANLKLPLFLVLGLIVAVYLPVLSFGFVAADDPDYIIRNPYVYHPNLFAIFDPRTLVVSDWTPLVTLSHAVEFFFFGMNTLIFHLDNLLLHLACVILVWRLLLVLNFSSEVALAAALVFGVHPLQVESVAWLSARKNLLSTLFGLLYLLDLLKDRPRRSLVFLVMALLSKGTAVFFPVLALALLFLQKKSTEIKKHAPLFTLLFILCAVRGVLSMYAQSLVITARTGGVVTLSLRMATMGPIIIRQLVQFLFPHDLAFMYALTVRDWSGYAAIGSWVIILIFIVAALCARSDRFRVALALAIIPFLPTANIIPAPWFQADRYLYLSILGLSIFLAIGIFQSSPRSIFGKILFGVWVGLILVPLCHERIFVWQNDKNLWSDVVEKNPNALAWNNLGIVYVKEHHPETALAAFSTALQLNPDYPDSLFNRARVLNDLGKTAEAMRDVELYLQKQPDDPDALALKKRISGVS